MVDPSTPVPSNLEKLHLNLAIAGGGPSCAALLQLLKERHLPYLDLNIVGVSDVNPDTEGFRMAKEMGIFTTAHIRELCRIDGLNGIVELTDDHQTLLDIIRHKPDHVGIIDHPTGSWINTIFKINRKIKSEAQQVILETMSSDFLIQKSTAGIMVLNPDLTIFDVNDVLLKEVKKTREEAIGAYCYEISHELTAPCSSLEAEMECPVIETLRTGKSAHTIHDHSFNNSNTQYCNLVTYPIKNQDGEIIRIIKIRRDITEAVSHRWEKKIMALKEDMNKLIQEDRMISLGKLVASSAHEINNPIQGLLTFSHLIREILDTDRPDKEDLNKIFRITHKL